MTDMREYHRQYYLKHREEIRAQAKIQRALPAVKAQRADYNRRYAVEHRAQVNAAQLRWRRAHADRVRIYQRNWKRKHPQRKTAEEKEAHSKWKREVWYPFKKAEAQRKQAARCEEVRQVIRAFKDVPCADCGLRFPHYVMDFDHVRGQKTMCVGQMLNATHLRKVLEEIEKCEVVCANCHRVRTHTRRKNSA